MTRLKRHGRALCAAAILAGLALTLPAQSTVEKLRCPIDMVQTGVGTCIDRYEWPNIKGAHPVIGLTALPQHRDERAGEVWDLTALCDMVGKRVCTRTEWTSACRGSDRSRYPWGNAKPTKKPHPCNTDKLWKQPNEKKLAERDHAEFERLDQSEPAGSREDCVSASGAYDMIGNAEEWVTCPGVGAHGWCLMSRHWAALVTCDYAVTVHHPRWTYYVESGRCCRDMTVD